MDGSLGSRIEHAHHPMDANMCGHRHQGFAGQPLLGLAYPTTPYIGLNDSPVMCERCKAGGHLHSNRNDGRRGGTVGGAAAAAQHVLLAAAPHMGRGGLALLTPPDDNGILDWQQHDAMHRIQADREPTERIVSSVKSPVSQNSAPPVVVEQNPRESEGHADKPLKDGLLPEAPSALDSFPKPEQRSTNDELNASTEGEWIGSAIETLGLLPIS
jgi:hypothetical protein